MNRLRHRIRRLTRGTLVLSLALSLALSLGVAATAAEDADNFRNFCAACHGESGRGGNMGGPSLVDIDARGLTNEDIALTLEEGRIERGMPSFSSSLSAAEIDGMVAYIRQLQSGSPSGRAGMRESGPQPQAAESSEAVPVSVRGRDLFASELGCVNCHSIHNWGGRTAPDLTLVHERMSRQDIQAAILQPSKEIAVGYEVREIVTRDGRAFSGWMRTGRTPEGSFQLYNAQESVWTTYFERDLATNRVVAESLMPQGLLDGLSAQDVDNLLDYLASPKPLP